MPYERVWPCVPKKKKKNKIWKNGHETLLFYCNDVLKCSVKTSLIITIRWKLKIIFIKANAIQLYD